MSRFAMFAAALACMAFASVAPARADVLVAAILKNKEIYKLRIVPNMSEVGCERAARKLGRVEVPDPNPLAFPKYWPIAQCPRALSGPATHLLTAIVQGKNESDLLELQLVPMTLSECTAAQKALAAMFPNGTALTNIVTAGCTLR